MPREVVGIHPAMKAREDSIRLAKLRIKLMHERSNLGCRDSTDAADTEYSSTAEPGHKIRFRRASASEANRDPARRGFVNFLRASLKLSSSKLNALGQQQERTSMPNISSHTYHPDAPLPLPLLVRRSKDGQQVGWRRASAPGDGQHLRDSVDEVLPQPAAIPEGTAASAP